MEIFTKKNILIGLAVIVAIPVIFTVGVKAYEEIDYYFYTQSKKKGVELGKDHQTITQNIHSTLKNKNRDDAYALHCMDGGNKPKNSRDRKDKTFDKFWEQAKDEDYSESTVRLEDYNGEQNPSIYVENIKTDDGNTFSRSFSIGGTTVGEYRYNCTTFVPRRD